jgi:predicted nucleotidyltransferase
VTVDLGGIGIPVLGLDDLIANKRAAGRAKDQADAEMLEAVRALSRRR